MTIVISTSDQNALDTHAKLINRAFEYLDGQISIAILCQQVGLVTSEINRRLARKPVRPQMTREPVIVDSEYVARPELLQKPVSLEIVDGDKKYAIDYVDPINITAGISQPEIYDRPTKYTIDNGNFRFFPAPAVSYTASFLYFKKLPAINEDVQSNWFLSDNPDVYLDGLLYNAYKYLPDIDKAKAHWDIFDNTLNDVLMAYPKPPKVIKLRTERALYQNNDWHSFT